MIFKRNKAKQLENLIKAYELKPGSYYLIEVMIESGVSPDSLKQISRRFDDHGINIFFVMTRGGKPTFHAVPAEERL